MDAEPYLIVDSPADFDIYTQTFIQYIPKYGTKAYIPGAHWQTIRRPLNDGVVRQHLNGNRAVGVISQWYCRYGVIDIDDRTKAEAEDIRAALGFDAKNSLLFKSESPDSWHLYFRPTLNGQPPPVGRFNNAFRIQAKDRRVEVYPQKNRVFRLPLGRGQELATTTGFLYTQTDLLHEFLKLEPYDITQLEAQQDFDFQGRAIGQGLILPTHNGFMAEAAGYYEHGLLGPSTRHHAQFCVAALLYRKYNLPPDQVCREVWKWICTKHNGFSKDIIRYPQRVKYEIKKQVEWLYHNNDLGRAFPDQVHNGHNGYISKQDIPEIIEAAGGSMPRSRFLFYLVKYINPRRFRPFVPVHFDRFVEWGAQRTYTKYLNELEAKGLVKRGSAYSVGRFAKSISLKWDFKTSDSILIEGRAVDTFEDALKLTHSASDFRELLQAKGAERTAALRATRSIYS
jgi:hypothetical protein